MRKKSKASNWINPTWAGKPCADEDVVVRRNVRVLSVAYALILLAAISLPGAGVFKPVSHLLAAALNDGLALPFAVAVYVVGVYQTALYIIMAEPYFKVQRCLPFLLAACMLSILAFAPVTFIMDPDRPELLEPRWLVAAAMFMLLVSGISLLLFVRQAQTLNKQRRIPARLRFMCDQFQVLSVAWIGLGLVAFWDQELAGFFQDGAATFLALCFSSMLLIAAITLRQLRERLPALAAARRLSTRKRYARQSAEFSAFEPVDVFFRIAQGPYDIVKCLPAAHLLLRDVLLAALQFVFLGGSAEYHFVHNRGDFRIGNVVHSQRPAQGRAWIVVIQHAQIFEHLDRSREIDHAVDFVVS